MNEPASIPLIRHWAGKVFAAISAAKERKLIMSKQLLATAEVELANAEARVSHLRKAVQSLRLADNHASAETTNTPDTHKGVTAAALRVVTEAGRAVPTSYVRAQLSLLGFDTKKGNFSGNLSSALTRLVTVRGKLSVTHDPEGQRLFSPVNGSTPKP